MTPASGSASVAMSSVKGAGRGKRAGQQVHWQHPEIPGTITSMAATPSTRHHPDNSPHTAPVMKTPWVICGLNLLNIFADLNKQILSSFFVNIAAVCDKYSEWSKERVFPPLDF